MKILAVDYGESRTGIAVCDVLEFMASPLTVIFEKNTEKAIQKIAETVHQQKAELVVVGMPVNMDGSHGERAQKCRQVADAVQQLVSVPVTVWDERASTKTALAILSENGSYGKKRKQVLDAVAATVILESYLAYRKNQKKTD